MTIRLIMAAVLTASLGLSAAEFHVKDYGAQGDGTSDDGPAIREAVAAAIEAGPGSKVVFEKKTYRLARARQSYHISLNGVTGLTIEGNGAELINNPYNSIVQLDECENVTFRGFVLDCYPLPFTQGTITGVDAKTGSFTLKIQEGYDNPVEAYRKAKKKPYWGFGVCMEPKERRRKPGVSMNLFMQDVKETEKGLLRVQLVDKSRKEVKGIAIGDRFVITMKYGGRGANFSVRRSKDCWLENNTIYTTKYGMTHSLGDNRGRIHIKGVKITFKPGTDRLITTPCDGFHCKHNAVGPIIEDGLFEGMLDDSINISVCPYWVRKDLGGNRYLVANNGSTSPQVGNTLMAYRPKPGNLTYGLVVKAIEPQPTPKGARGTWKVITLSKPIPNLGLHTGDSLFPGGKEKMVFTGLYNIDASGKDYIVRNNVFRAQRRHALLARTSGGLFENNIVDGVGGCGVCLGNESGSFYEGPLPTDTVIRNNTFSNTYSESIRVYTKGKGAVARNITIVGNRWLSKGENDVISLRNVEGGVVKDNLIMPDKTATPVRMRNCKDIKGVK